MSKPILTPQNSPGHHTVGRNFAGHSYESDMTEIYFCDSYDPAIGYWLTNVANSSDRKNVSERAIGRTFHLAEERADHWYVPQWGVRIPKVKT